MSAVQKLNEIGQSLWYDNIQRRLLQNGEMAGMIARGEIRGVTSNPSIFMNAIAKSHDYDTGLTPMAWSGWTAEEIFWQLAVEDIRAAADLFLPLYKASSGGDGYVSLEVSPFLAHDTTGTLAEAKRLWQRVDRPNLMIKIPATVEGLPAIAEAIAAGINVNVTLIFSRERYAKVMDAYLSGLEKRAAAGQPVNMIASVASFFVSRVDTKIDARLNEMAKQAGPQAEQAARMVGKAAIANARLAYADYQAVFGSPRFQALKTKGACVQRPLWASTSTKNPAYRDVIYIEELIGPDTVNTVPPQTLVAFVDHGQARASLVENVEQARQDLTNLEKLGIALDEVTRQLEDEGVKAFADAFRDLLKAVDERRLAALSELGPLQKEVAARVQKLAAEEAPRRLWAHDATFWTQDAAGQAEVRKRLGWLDAPERSRSMLPDLARLIKDCQAAGYTHTVLLGMGGSSLAPEVLSLTFGSREIYGAPALELLILDSTDPAQVRATGRWSEVEKTLYIVSSKSGTTSEINAYLDYFWARAKRKLGEKAAEHFVAITDPNTKLETLAHERKFRHVFQADATVGGRFSALTAFGLVPAALLGLDASLLLNRAAGMAAQCAADRPAAANPGLVLGAIMGEAALQGRDKITLLADPQLSSFGSWLEQLIAESSGKQGRGIVPVDIEPPLPGKKYGEDRLFVHLRFGGDSDGETAKHAAEIRKAGQPVLTLAVSDAYDLSAEFMRWEVATSVACAVLGVNAFDQPDVQDNKDRTQNKVTSYQQTHALDEGQPIWEGTGGRVYGWNFPGLNGARTLADVVKAFIAQSHPGDYIAVNAYLPRNERTLASLQKLRSRLLKTTQRATTLGFGPRFLHSTGQLHKGGANNGMFLQITSESSADIEIPTEGLTFGALERCQALGDLEALLARGKRAIRIHLVDGAIKDLID
jgi:transaldolase / glucose-6-phosphate isomerase